MINQEPVNVRRRASPELLSASPQPDGMTETAESKPPIADAKHDSVPKHTQNLSPNEKKGLEELKKLCETNGVFWPASSLERQSQQINDDTTLLRFLRARGLDVQAAFKQYSNTVTWRNQHSIDEAYDNVGVKEYETRRRLLPHWIGRRDKNGSPIQVYVVSAIDPSDISRTGKEDPNLTSIFMPAEYSVRFVDPMCARINGDRNMMLSSTNIIDLSNVGLKGFWSLKGLLQTSSNMATAHYPESVERIFVVGAPSFFPMIWGFIERWFDKATTQKIFVLPASKVTSTLSEYIDINDIPKRFGGNLEWEFPSTPNVDGLTSDFIGDAWPVEGPVRFLSGVQLEDGRLVDQIIAVGTEDGEMRRQVLKEWTLG